MRISTALSDTLAVAVAIVLAACSSGSSQIAPNPVERPSVAGSESASYAIRGGHILSVPLPLESIPRTQHPITAPSFMNPDAVAKPLLFVSDGASAVVDIYLQARKQRKVGQITGFNQPLGLAADSAANLYVADYSNENVPIYAPPYTGSPKLTLVDGGYAPNGVSVSSTGIVAVTSFNPGAISFYAKNSTSACATIVDATNFRYVNYDAFDDKGNLYIDGTSSNENGAIGEIAGGCGAKNITLLTTSNSTPQADGIQVDKSGRISVLDKFYGAIYTYDPPKNGTLGSPVATTPLTSSDAIDFTFLASGKDVYTADYDQGTAKEYDYPAGGAAKKSIAVGGVNDGIAVTSPLAP
jgi:hypothetical protein